LPALSLKGRSSALVMIPVAKVAPNDPPSPLR
jgi:hypothetical protein